MKKLITLVLALVCVLGLVGCNQKAVSASEVYSFPEPTTMITVSFYSQGEETAFEIGSEEYDSNDLSTTPVINWFYDLKLTACDEPEAVEGSESYEFYVKGESAFTYEDRGSSPFRQLKGFCQSSKSAAANNLFRWKHKKSDHHSESSSRCPHKYLHEKLLMCCRFPGRKSDLLVLLQKAE